MAEVLVERVFRFSLLPYLAISPKSFARSSDLRISSYYYYYYYYYNSAFISLLTFTKTKLFWTFF